MAISTNIEGNYFVLKNTVSDTEITRYPKNKINFRADNDQYFDFIASDTNEIVYSNLRFADLIDGRTGLAFASFADATTYLSGVLSNSDGDLWQYAEVAISRANILSLGSLSYTSDILVPEGVYPEFQSIFFEFTPGETPYNLGTITYLAITTQNAVAYTGDAYILTESSNAVLKLVEDSFLSSDTETSYSSPSNGSDALFVLSTGDGGLGENPTLGDGTGLLKIKYRFRTFGSEL